MSIETNASGPKSLEALNLDERRRMNFQLMGAVGLAIEEVAKVGRLDLVGPLHDISRLLKMLRPDIASSTTFQPLAVPVRRARKELVAPEILQHFASHVAKRDALSFENSSRSSIDGL